MDEGRARFLDSLPRGISFDPCKCPSVKGYRLVESRNMWACGHCEKPSGAHRGYSPFCYECGEPFTYEVAPVEKEKYPFCPQCE